MRYAYLDESATPNNAVYMFGILLVDDAQLCSIEDDMDKLGELVHKWCPSISKHQELHGYEVFHGVGQWEKLSKAQLVTVCTYVAKIIGSSGATLMIRGVNQAGLTARYGSGADPIHEVAYGHALECTEREMGLRHDDQRVLLFADEHHSAPNGRRRLRLARNRAEFGRISVPLKHFADTIYFTPSHHSRLIQAVDMATYLYQRFTYHRETHPKAKAAMTKVRMALSPALGFTYEWLN